MSEHIFRTEQQEDGTAVYVEKDTGIVSAKPAQLGEIVRCIDCKKRRCRLEIFGDKCVYWCNKLGRYVDPRDFCAWGERAS